MLYETGLTATLTDGDTDREFTSHSWHVALVKLLEEEGLASEIARMAARFSHIRGAIGLRSYWGLVPSEQSCRAEQVPRPDR